MSWTEEELSCPFCVETFPFDWSESGEGDFTDDEVCESCGKTYTLHWNFSHSADAVKPQSVLRAEMRAEVRAKLKKQEAPDG